jgi:hypothetical protein
VKNSKPSPPTSYRSFFVSRHREKMTLGPSTGALTACLFHFFFNERFSFNSFGS